MPGRVIVNRERQDLERGGHEAPCATRDGVRGGVLLCRRHLRVVQCDLHYTYIYIYIYGARLVRTQIVITLMLRLQH